MKVLKLNTAFGLVLSSEKEPGSLSGNNFEANEDWVIKTDQGKQFATRYIYTTKYAKDKKIYFKCGNATAAIKQVLITEFPDKKLKDVFFKILELKSTI